MSMVRVEVKVFLGGKKPVAKFNFDETTLGNFGEVVKFVQALPILGGGRT